MTIANFRMIEIRPLIYLLLSGLFLSQSLQAELQFPKEGRWSVATGWTDEWPDQWKHLNPTKSEKAGDWTILYGELKLAEGVLLLKDSERVRPDGLSWLLAKRPRPHRLEA